MINWTMSRSSWQPDDWRSWDTGLECRFSGKALVAAQAFII
jgi:hypothetical protein